MQNILMESRRKRCWVIDANIYTSHCRGNLHYEKLRHIANAYLIIQVINVLELVRDLRRCWRFSDSNKQRTPQMFRWRFRYELDKRKLKKDKEKSSKWMQKTSINWIKMLINSEVLSSVTFTVCCSRNEVQKHMGNLFGFKNFLN